MGVLATLDASGWNYADYPTTLAYVQNLFTSVFPADVYLEPDSKDLQLLAIFATAMYDNNQTFAAVINSLSPTYAQGVQLSNEVLVNGISRHPATYSMATLTLTGTVGTVISGASVKDANGNTWDIASGVLDSTGTALLLATCVTAGAVTALANTINQINTPIFGWSTVNNVNAATTGMDAESDYLLRQRQSISTALPSITAIGGLNGGLLSVLGVTRVKVYENATGAVDANGLPAHSITAIVEGGDGQTIANQIALRKTMGCLTNGTNTFTTTDSMGISQQTSFSVLIYNNLKMAITIHPLTGYISSTLTAIQTALSTFISGLNIGDDVSYSKLYTVAYLSGSALGQTYNITSLQIGLLSGSLGTADIVVAFNQAAALAVSNVVISIA
jgi:uncharacterized phage protein gp47/JayE